MSPQPRPKCNCLPLDDVGVAVKGLLQARMPSSLSILLLHPSSALCSRFQPVHVPEPTVDETFEIMLGLRER